MTATLDATGLTIETFDTAQARWRANALSLFGATADVSGASLLGKLIDLAAASDVDLQELAAAIYAGYYPSTATGVALDLTVELGGLIRKSATKSTATIQITAIAPGTIPVGVVVLVAGTGARFSLDAAVVFAAPGALPVGVTAIESGAVAAPSGTLTTFEDGTYTAAGYTVTNGTDGDPGLAAESDETLRERFFASYHLPGSATVDGLRAELLGLDGVSYARTYENAANLVDATLDNAPGHSLVAVVSGGTDVAVAQAIWDGKAAGILSWGGAAPTTANATDDDGVLHAIDFMRPVAVVLTATVTFTNATGYAVDATVAAAVKAYVDALNVGDDVNELLVRSAAILALDSVPDAATVSVSYTADGGAPFVDTSTVINFNKIATLALVDIVIVGL